MMMFKCVLVLTVIAVLASPILTLPTQVVEAQQLENAFNDRAVVLDIIDCFIGKKKCSPMQTKIKERALATMKNFGSCPPEHCTPEQQTEMTRSMELLQSKHPDLWTRLIASMFGIEV